MASFSCVTPRRSGTIFKSSFQSQRSKLFLVAPTSRRKSLASPSEADNNNRGGRPNLRKDGQNSSQDKSLPVVPWGLNTTVTVMVVWLCGFIVAAYYVVPVVLELVGVNSAATTGRAAAGKHLVLDVIQLGFTLLLLKRALRNYEPRSLGLFAVTIRPVKSWIIPAFFGALTFPFIELVHRRLVEIIEQQTGQGVVHGMVENVALQGDWLACTAWIIVLALCAPIWEEVIFRGFLIPSLAKNLPTWAAVVSTSLIFAGVHFSNEGFLPLVLLGLVFGTVYVKTKNLLPAILLHSLWNIVLLWQLLGL